MTNEEHNEEAQKLLKEVDISKCSPLGWDLVWNNNGVPVIVDAHGKLVAVISTGTFQDGYETEQIMANIKRLLNGNTIIG